MPRKDSAKASPSRQCPYCKSKKVVLRGFRKNLSGNKQLFLCRTCGRKFTKDDGYLRMRFPPSIIKEALSLRSKGYSTSDVSKHMERKGSRISRWTVICWERKFRDRKSPF